MGALKTIGLRLAVGWVLVLLPLAVQAAVHMHAPRNWYRGQSVTIEAFSDADTAVDTFEFHSRYVPSGNDLEFLGVLELQNDPKTTLPEPIECDVKSVCFRFEAPTEVEDSSSFASFLGATIPKGTVVKWSFVVKADAQLGVVNVPLNVPDGPLMVEADGVPVQWLGGDGQEFRIVPENSSWILMLVGLAAVGARAFQRRTAG